MPTPTLTRELWREAEALIDEHGTPTAAARETGMARATLQHRIDRGRQLYGHAREPEFEPPDLVSEEMPTQDLIERRVKGFRRAQAAAKSREWMKFKVKTEGPVALAFFGDPHLDDNGCNWPLLLRDINLVRETPGVFGIGMGDYTNNWAGRLAQKVYPHQETTRNQSWQLAEWFFGSGKEHARIPWLILIKGNHDLWSGPGRDDPLTWMEHGAAPLEDWQARFVVQSPNGHETKIWTAHNFPGTSIYNPLHGPMRKGKFGGGGMASLYICGHQHHWGLFQVEDPDREGTYWSARTRGYKYIDDHAQNTLGHQPQQYGATITAIIDPDKQGPAALQCFADLEEAADYLKFKRKRWERKK